MTFAPLLRALARSVAALLPACVAAHATAQPAADYPAKAIQFVICYAPGGGLDVVGRIVAEQLTRNLGRQIVVENRPGAGGNIGTAYVAKAAPDGYTLLETTNSHNINPLIYRNAGYHPRKDFVAVAQLTEAPSVIVANPRGPFRSLEAMIAAARAAPGTLVYGSAGNGSPTNIAMEMFKAAAGIDITHVPYKSAAQSHVDVIGGQTPLAMAALPSIMTHLQSGALRALAITSVQRWPTVKEVPTVAESGYAGYSHMTWIGVLAPAGTSSVIVDRLNGQIGAVLQNDEVRERIARTGAQPVVRSAADFENMMKTEYEATGRVVAKIGLRVE